MAQSNLGKVMLTPRGNYSAGATYNMLDFVLYGGASFVALENNLSGVTPSAASPSWQLLAAAAEEITVVSQEVEYAAQAAADYTGDPPESGWSSEIPPATNGNYLWTRIITTYSDGSSFTAYLVAKNGVNGSGAVSSVNGVSPDASGNVLLNIGSIATVDSTPTAGSTNLVTSGGVNQFVYGVVTTKENISNKVSAWSATPNDNRYPSEKLVKDSLNSLSATKVDKAQGAQHSGKLLGINAQGNVEPVNPPQSGVTSVNGRTGEVTGIAEKTDVSISCIGMNTGTLGILCPTTAYLTLTKLGIVENNKYAFLCTASGKVRATSSSETEFGIFSFANHRDMIKNMLGKSSVTVSAPALGNFGVCDILQDGDKGYGGPMIELDIENNVFKIGRLYTVEGDFGGWPNNRIKTGYFNFSIVVYAY